MKNKILNNITKISVIIFLVSLGGILDINNNIQIIPFILFIVSSIWNTLFFAINKKIL